MKKIVVYLSFLLLASTVETMFQQKGYLTTSIQLFTIRVRIDLGQITKSIDQLMVNEEGLIEMIKNSKIKDEWSRRRLRTAFKQIAHLIGETKEEINHISQLTEAVQSQKREKRQLLAVGAAAVAVGAFLASGSIFNSFLGNNDALMSETMDLTTQKMAEQEERLRLLNETVTKIMIIDRDILGRVDEMEKLQRAMLGFEEITLSLTILIKEMNELKDGIMDAIHHKLSPKLISPKSAAQLLTNANTKIPRKLVQAVTVTHLADFYALPCIVIRENDLLQIMTHLPTYSDKDLLEFYIHTPIPMWNQEEDVIMSLESNRQYLAISRTKTAYRELSSDDIANCQQINQVKLCPNIRILRKGHDSCLKALLLNQMEIAYKVCRLFLYSSSQLIGFERDRNNFTLTSKSQVSALRQCDNDNGITRDNIVLKPGITNINLDHDCVLNADTLTISTLPAPIEALVTELFPILEIRPANLSNYLELHHGSEVDIQSVQDTLNKWTKVEKIPIASVLQKAKELREAARNPWRHFLHYGLTLLALVIGVILSSFLFRRYCIFRNRRQGQQRITQDEDQSVAEMESLATSVSTAQGS